MSIKLTIFGMIDSTAERVSSAQLRSGGLSLERVFGIIPSSIESGPGSYRPLLTELGRMIVVTDYMRVAPNRSSQ